MKQVTDTSFESDVLNGGVVLVDFWAEWCGPCKMLTPTLEKLSEDYTNVTFTKINVDENPEMATKYNIRSIPSMLIFDNGTVVSTKTGALQGSKLKEWIDSVIS